VSSEFLAVDLGAESGRAMLGRLRAGVLDLSELHRFPNEPRRANGALRWTGTLTSKPSAAPAVAGGYVYVPTISGQLAVFSAAGCGAPTCTPVWTAQTGSSIGQPPSITSGGLVYTGSDDGSIHAYSASGCGSPTCTSLWSVATGSKITGGPVNALGRVFVGTADGRIIAYSL